MKKIYPAALAALLLTGCQSASSSSDDAYLNRLYTVDLTNTEEISDPSQFQELLDSYEQIASSDLASYINQNQGKNILICSTISDINGQEFTVANKYVECIPETAGTDLSAFKTGDVVYVFGTAGENQSITFKSAIPDEYIDLAKGMIGAFSSMQDQTMEPLPLAYTLDYNGSGDFTECTIEELKNIMAQNVGQKIKIHSNVYAVGTETFQIADGAITVTNCSESTTEDLEVDQRVSVGGEILDDDTISETFISKGMILD